MRLRQMSTKVRIYLRIIAMIWIVLMSCIISWGAFAATPTITGVTAQQRYPWNGKVDITYKVTGDIAGYVLTNGLAATLKVTASDKVANKSYTTTLSGTSGLTTGNHKIVWDFNVKGIVLKSTNVVFTVSCETNHGTYCVIDLSAGANASSYPVTYLSAAPSGGFTTDTYRTTKLVLRRIEAGSFIMGSDQSNTTHRVTLTRPFFMGVFEVTQKQYMLVMGSNPVDATSSDYGDAYPVYSVPYDTIRGASNGSQWPSSSGVDTTSFMGKLRSRTNLNLDLPTEAQWEYACRAGTTTSYYWGSSSDDSENYAWHIVNASWMAHPVGAKLPNAWGLYDMNGNVREWNLDWYWPLAYGTDPKGSTSGSYRVTRGACYSDPPYRCTSYYRDYREYPSNGGTTGFRLCWTVP